MQQYGFRKGSSCELAILSAMDYWFQEIDKGNIAGALLIDLSKAFDSVPHMLLLQELTNIGCSISSMNWFSNYLSNRMQRVTFGAQVTEWQEIGKGVPQGSCLSPLLFNIYVRELPLCCTSPSYQFADDLTASDSGITAEEVIDKLTVSYSNIKEFCNEKGLKINANKTQLIIFKAPSKKIPDDLCIKIDSHSIQPVKHVKLLGVILDRHLTFKEDVDRIINQCHGLIGILSRSAHILPTELLKLIYTSLIRPHLEYAGAIRATVAPTQLKRLETVQKICSRIILHCPRDTHAAPLLQKLGLEQLSVRREEHIIRLVQNILSGSCHPAFQSLFTASDEDGSVLSTTPAARIGYGNRRLGIYARELYNKQS